MWGLVIQQNMSSALDLVPLVSGPACDHLLDMNLVSLPGPHPEGPRAAIEGEGRRWVSGNTPRARRGRSYLCRLSLTQIQVLVYLPVAGLPLSIISRSTDRHG